MVLIGHYANLQEAEKLTESYLIGGLVQEYIKNGGILGLTSPGLPVAQFSGLDVSWNREKNLPTASFVDPIGAILTWQSGQDFDKLTRRLRSIYIQTYLDNYLPEVYQTKNNYRAIQLLADSRAMIERFERSFIYGHQASSAEGLEFDGLHTIASRYPLNRDNETLDINMDQDPLSLHRLRVLTDHMKHGIDYLIMPKALARRFDEYAQEGGVRIDNTQTLVGRMSYGPDEFGRKVSYWDNIPIIRSDYMLPEIGETGETDATRRAVESSASGAYYSILAVKFGQVYEAQPGVTLAWGNNGGGNGELWKTVVFDKFEDRDAEGIRLVSHMSLLDGSTMAVGRIYDIADAPLAA